MTCVSTDDLEPALRTTVQLLGDLSICSGNTSAQVQGASAQVQGASAQVQGASAQEPGASAQVHSASAQLDYLLKEMKALAAEKDLELRRYGLDSLSNLPLLLYCAPPSSPFFSVGALGMEPHPADIS